MLDEFKGLYKVSKLKSRMRYETIIVDDLWSLWIKEKNFNLMMNLMNHRDFGESLTNIIPKAYLGPV